jgi:hypothetical protein
MKFHGDLIITDPQFVVKDADDWKKCAYGDRMDQLGLATCLTALMTEGEEDLAAYDQNGNLLGTFVSDSGVAGAFLLEEILAYDPEFDEHTACPENALWLPDFDGEIQVEGQGEDQHFIAHGSQDFTTR